MKIQLIIVPKTIVGIRYAIVTRLLGTSAPIPIVINMDSIMENKTAIPVDMIVNEDISIDFNSWTAILSP